MFKRSQLIVGVLIALLLLLSACSQENTNGKAQNDQNTGVSEQRPSGNETAAPADIRLFISDHGLTIPAAKSMDIEEIKFLAEQTNTNLDVHFLSHSDYNSQLRLRFGGGDFPDVFQHWQLHEITLNAIDNGQIMDLTELIEEHGPNLKERIPPEVWEEVTVDGKIIAIPEPRPAPINQSIYVRADIMDELNLKIPETSEEYLDMLRAVKNAYPNMIPMTLRENVTWGEHIYGMWGLNWNKIVEHEGELIPGAIHPDMKKALAFKRQMYEEGLLDSEFLTNSSSVWDQKISSGQAFNWLHTTSQVPVWHNKLKSSLGNEAEIRVIPTPRAVGHDGPIGHETRELANKTFFVHAGAKNPEAIIRLFDWLITDEGRIFSELGIEGKTYERDGDKLTHLSEVEQDLQLRFRRVFVLHGFDEQAAAAINNEDMASRLAAAYDFNREIGHGTPNLIQGMPPSGVSTDLQGMFEEAAALIIVQGAPIDETFDRFVENWRNSGGNDEIKYMTDWYNQ